MGSSFNPFDLANLMRCIPRLISTIRFHHYCRHRSTMVSNPSVISSTELSAADAKSAYIIPHTARSLMIIPHDFRWITLKKIKYADADGTEVNILILGKTLRNLILFL